MCEQPSSQTVSDDVEEMIPSVLKHDVFIDWKEKTPWICTKRISNRVVGLMCSSGDSIKDLSRRIHLSKERLKISSEWLTGVTADN